MTLFKENLQEMTRTPKSGVTTIVLTQPHSIEPALDNHLIHVA